MRALRNNPNPNPDIALVDKKMGVGVIMDVIIANAHSLSVRESEKVAKYQLLADQIKQIYDLKKVVVVPIAISPDGVVSKNFDNYSRKIGLTRKTIAYLQQRVIKKSIDIVLNTSRKSNEYFEKESDMMKRREEMLNKNAPLLQAPTSSLQSQQNPEKNWLNNKKERITDVKLIESLGKKVSKNRERGEKS